MILGTQSLGALNYAALVVSEKTAKPSWLQAPHLRAVHGFSTRQHGVSQAPYAGLNLSSRVGDNQDDVAENRILALSILGLQNKKQALLKQIHSNQVLVLPKDRVLVAPKDFATAVDMPEADASVTEDPNSLLIIETADCYPVLLEDVAAGVVGAAHAGWRGTASKIVAGTVLAMQKLGAKPARIRAAIGPGICSDRYQIGEEVHENFLSAGFPEHIFSQRTSVLEQTTSPAKTQWHLDLGQANAWVLEQAGVPHQNIWQANCCSTTPDFFSYRRDAGRTGRMWAVISAEWRATP